MLFYIKCPPKSLGFDHFDKITNIILSLKEVKLFNFICRELKKLSAAQFMEVWEHYDEDGESTTDI